MHQLRFQKALALNFLISGKEGRSLFSCTESLLSNRDCAGIRGHLTILYPASGHLPPSQGPLLPPANCRLGSIWVPTVVLCLPGWSRAPEPASRRAQSRHSFKAACLNSRRLFPSTPCHTWCRGSLPTHRSWVYPVCCQAL